MVGTYAATSTDGRNWQPLGGTVSTVTHQPQQEMFASRQVPFQGDYNWAAVFPGGSSVNVVWTDNREVADGPDPHASSPKHQSSTTGSTSCNAWSTSGRPRNHS